MDTQTNDSNPVGLTRKSKRASDPTYASSTNGTADGSSSNPEPKRMSAELHQRVARLRRPSMSKSSSSPPAHSVPHSTAHVIRSEKKVFRRRYSFKSRTSRLDTTALHLNREEFRGFFTLFWITMAFYVILTMIRSRESEGTLITLSLFSLFSKDAVALMISDLTMVALTVFCVPFTKLMVWGILPYNPYGHWLQHTFQALFLGVNVYWTFWREWPWVQSGYFTLHTLVMMMKMHSYTQTNGECSQKLLQLKKVKAELSKAIADAIAKGELYDTSSHMDMDGDQVSEWESEADTNTATPDSSRQPTPAPDKADDGPKTESQIRVANIRAEIAELEEDLRSGNTVFPNNVTLVNYLDYLLVPSLVYELEFPRTDTIRPWYIFEKTVATLGTFLLLYVTTERYITPTVYDLDMPWWRAILELLFPFMTNYLLIFYIIFECICNVFAEISFFADHDFYDDWWNSTSYDEFARKWNKPVHHFLLRHVYASSIDTYKLSKHNATMLTFFLSSCLHELVLVIVTKKVRMYLFVLQMLQVPLIYIFRIGFIRARPWLGNGMFWLGMFMGPPLLGVLYCREWFWSEIMGNPLGAGPGSGAP